MGMLFRIIVVVVILSFVAALSLVEANIRASILALFTSVLLAIFAHHLASMRAVKASHFTKKADAYKILFDMLFELISETKGTKNPNPKRLLNNMMEFKKQLLIWGSHETMKAMWAISEHQNASEISTDQMLKDLEALIRAARNDLGHEDSHIPNGELLALIVNRE